MSRTKSVLETEATMNSAFFESYKAKFGDKKQQLSRENVGEILAGCGISEEYVVNSTYTVLMNIAATKKKKGEAQSDADKVPYSVFYSVCKLLATGTDLEKVGFIFDFIDLDKSGIVDKNEIAIVFKHLLACRVKKYGAELVLYDFTDAMDLYFNIEADTVMQLKANRFAHDAVLSAHGGGRHMGMDKKQFTMWFNKGGKAVDTVKTLFSCLGMYEDVPPKKVE